jgi:hypothetical protein
MIKKNEIRDVALVAVIQHFGYSCVKNSNGSFTAHVSDDQFGRIFATYRVNYRPVISRLRRLETKLPDPLAKVKGVPRDENPVSQRSKGAF